MASSSLNKNKENDRSKSVNNIDDLAAKVDQLLKGNQSQVFIMEKAASENNFSDATPEGDITVDDQKEVSYVNGQGWQYKNYHPNPNVWNNPHLFAYPKTDKPVDNTQNSQGQNSGYQKPYQGRTYVLIQAQHNYQPYAQTAESVKRQQGTLPGKTDKNPKECSAVALRSGRTLPDAVPEKLSAAEKGKQKEGEQPLSQAPPLSDEEPEQSAETDPTHVATIVELVPPCEYTPKVPYPIPAKTSRKDRGETKCKKMLEDLTIKLPLMDAIQMIPSMRKLMKGLISGKITGDGEILLVSKECIAVLQNRPIKKLDDPGKFVLSIQIGKTVFACSLCDLDPVSTSCLTSWHNDWEDLHVRVGNTFVPTDFVVLEVEEEPRDPLILGRPFLCMAGAIIDVRQGKIDLHLGDIAMKFEMNKLLKKPIMDAQTYTVEDEDQAVFP
ncbi:PREDICTED: uncharacterized protein LOC106330666 [Brassica oleracea var. oleracea]|uniref:uncharacterized protein LOC106330666 n=1 Tax=Brassica oleracea var. oleracea TaxID=109376 RepID=UPI0006A71A7E|nr:PREDICTED: uncharacterized protein LOC106330666 [Brassica oleracea var. oleracea]